MKERKFNLSHIEELTLYTGTNGKCGCTCNCPGCSQTNYNNNKEKVRHHGTLDQVKEIMTLLPNLKKAYLLGNPDCSVDPIFCSKAAKLFAQNGIHVMFSTSGIGGKKAIQKLTDDIETTSIDYISFSINSVEPTLEGILKGREINYSTLLEGIEYCLSQNIPVKIQPTIWQINQEQALRIMKFFSSEYGIKWFTYHVGSEEGFFPISSKICRHVLPNDWYKLRCELVDYAKSNNIHAAIPLIFVTEEEYQEYIESYTPHCTNPNPTNIQIRMEKELKATFYPILSDIYQEQFTNILDKNMIPSQMECIKSVDKSCFVQRFSLGKSLNRNFNRSIMEYDNKKFIYVCRYYKITT